MFVIALLLNVLIDAQRMLLSFYMLPTLGSAYWYDRRHATLTAVGSVLMVALLFMTHNWFTTNVFGIAMWATVAPEFIAWGGVLIVIGYTMGTLCEHRNRQLTELRETYHGVLMLLRHFISKDEYTEHHSYRVSIYAASIASHLGLPATQIEDVRAAGLLHDIGKLEVSRELLYKAARFTREEFEEIQRHVDKGVAVLDMVGGSLRRVIPIVLAHHDKFNGSGYHPTSGNNIPIEARIVAVADVYDALTSDRPYRRAMNPFEARDAIEKGRGVDFDPQVVDAFLEALRFGELDARTVAVA